MGLEAPRYRLLGDQDYEKIKFPGRDISSLAAKELNKNMKILKKSHKFDVFWLFNVKETSMV